MKKCRPCMNAYLRKWAAANPEKSLGKTAGWAARNKEHKLAYSRRRAGVPEHGGKSVVDTCPLCGDNGVLVPDHCHRSGRFRGWICGRCNRALGTYEAIRPIISKLDAWLEEL